MTFGYIDRQIHHRGSVGECAGIVTWPFLQVANNGFGGNTSFLYEMKWAPGPWGSSPTCNDATWERQVVKERFDDPVAPTGGNQVHHVYTYTDGPRYYRASGANTVDAEYRGFRQARDTDGVGDYNKC